MISNISFQVSPKYSYIQKKQKTYFPIYFFEQVFHDSSSGNFTWKLPGLVVLQVKQVVQSNTELQLDAEAKTSRQLKQWKTRAQWLFRVFFLGDEKLASYNGESK